MPASLLRQRLDLSRLGNGVAYERGSRPGELRDRPARRPAPVGSGSETACAEGGTTIAGKLEAAEMPRLKGLLAGAACEVSASLTFRRDACGFVEVDGRIDGSLPVSCQRCLKEFDWDLRHEFRLALEDKLASGRQAPPGVELVEGVGDSIVPADLIEEEILLAMPFAPAHHSESECEPLLDSLSDDELGKRVDERAEIEAVSEKARPFASLANLLPTDDKSD